MIFLHSKTVENSCGKKMLSTGIILSKDRAEDRFSFYLVSWYIYPVEQATDI